MHRRTWLYPAGSVREYQYQIAYTAIKYNTLACLPTGLGKTLIAAVVMYNFYRWFPRVSTVSGVPASKLDFCSIMQTSGLIVPRGHWHRDAYVSATDASISQTTTNATLVCREVYEQEQQLDNHRPVCCAQRQQTMHMRCIHVYYQAVCPSTAMPQQSQKRRHLDASVPWAQSDPKSA
eukprot:GHUV01057398.1.p2 GENE.GHUV01057398.1~~GHUV01057398.1.p2  ORF type:complete len:178 (-),score=15.06 GHUV01057398.1:563-1096(-)